MYEDVCSQVEKLESFLCFQQQPRLVAVTKEMGQSEGLNRKSMTRLAFGETWHCTPTNGDLARLASIDTVQDRSAAPDYLWPLEDAHAALAVARHVKCGPIMQWESMGLYTAIHDSEASQMMTSKAIMSLLILHWAVYKVADEDCPSRSSLQYPVYQQILHPQGGRWKLEGLTALICGKPLQDRFSMPSELHLLFIV